MSASEGKASGGAHEQRSLRGLKIPSPTGRIEPETQEIEVEDYLPWFVSN